MKRIIQILSFTLLMVLYSFAEWQTEIVTVSYSGKWTSLALDSNDQPNLSYENAANSHLNYAYKHGSNWFISFFVDTSCYNGFWSSIAIDNNDYPCISYQDWEHFWLRYAWSIGTNWQIDIVDNDGFVGGYTSLALDSSDNPHISYYDLSHGALKYAFKNGSNWQISTIDPRATTGQYTSLKLGSDNKPHVSYYDVSNGDLMYASNNGSSWQISTVDSVGSVGAFSSLALDSNDNPHISYFDSDYNHLKYAYYNGFSWQTSTVDSQVGVGQWTSIALDNNNNPHISYYDFINHVLKYARYDGTNWHISIVDASADMGMYSSIELDSNDYPHIAYYWYVDSLHGHPMYAHYVSEPGVSLLSFTAQPQPDGAIKLGWQVAASDDTQIVGFNLYRADVGKARKKDWSKLNSSPITGHNPYQFVDSAVKPGQGYRYRLSALTADGKEEMLGTAQGEAGTTPAQFALTAVYPNPASSLLTCRLTMPQAGAVNLGLYDISGRLVLSRRLDLPTGEQETALEVGNLAKGIYTVRASSNGVIATKRIVVMR